RTSEYAGNHTLVLTIEAWGGPSSPPSPNASPTVGPTASTESSSRPNASRRALQCRAMREIEVKARVREPAATLAALDRLGIVLAPTIKQHDVVYGPPGAVADAPGVNWLRIRTVDDSRKCIFTLKRPVTSKLDSIEHETVVDDVAELTAIVQ